MVDTGRTAGIAMFLELAPSIKLLEDTNLNRREALMTDSKHLMGKGSQF